MDHQSAIVTLRELLQAWETSFVLWKWYGILWAIVLFDKFAVFCMYCFGKREQTQPRNWRALFIICHFTTICRLLYFTVMEESEENLEYCKV